MDKYLIATIKHWNKTKYLSLQEKYPDFEFLMIDRKEDLTVSFVESFNPRYIFFPHWSWMIPEEIYKNYNCVVFHMTDLPFGRGGSPLQNLLVRGIYKTKISAIKVCADVDAGPVYFKESVDISEGNADEILGKISDIVFEKMIPRFLEEDLFPVEQTGEVVTFKRRRPEQSEIPDGLSQRQMYDYIRMLDGEGYPPAFKLFDNYRILFTDARLDNGVLTTKARFTEEKEEDNNEECFGICGTS